MSVFNKEEGDDDTNFTYAHGQPPVSRLQ